MPGPLFINMVKYMSVRQRMEIRKRTHGDSRGGFITGESLTRTGESYLYDLGDYYA